MDYYDVLKIKKNSSDNDWKVIKSRFQHYFTSIEKRSPSEFGLFVEAYCILSHYSLKQIYDKALYDGSEEIFKKFVAYQFSFFCKQFDKYFEAVNLFFAQNNNDVLEWVQEEVSKTALSLIEFCENKDDKDELIVTTEDLKNSRFVLWEEFDEIFELLSKHMNQITEKWGDYVVINEELEDFKVEDVLKVVNWHARLVYTKFEITLFNEEVKTGIFEVIDELTRLRFFVGKFFHPDIETLIKIWKKELESVNKGELLLFFQEFREIPLRLLRSSLRMFTSVTLGNTKEEEEIRKSNEMIKSIISKNFSEDFTCLTYQNGWRESYNLVKKINIELEKTDPLNLVKSLKRTVAVPLNFWVVISLVLVLFVITIFFISLFSQWWWVYSKKKLKKENFRK